MRSTVLWSLALFSHVPFARGDGVELTLCAQPCLQNTFERTNCLDIKCLCTQDAELQQLFQCIFTSCNAVEYSHAMKTISGHCVSSTSTNGHPLVTRSSPIQLNINLNVGQAHDVEPGNSANAVPIADKLTSDNGLEGESLGHQPPIDLNINLNYGNTDSTGTSTSANPSIHVENPFSGGSIPNEKAPVIADCPPCNAYGDNALAPINPPGPFVSSGPPFNPPGPFFSSGPPSGGNGGNNASPLVITMTQTVTASPASGGSDSDSGAGAGSYLYCSSKGGGSSDSGAYSAGVGNVDGNGNRKGGACPFQPAMQGAFVETVFIMGTPSPLAIIPTTCPFSDNEGNSLPAYSSVTPVVVVPPPPPPPPTILAVTHTVGTPQPAPPPARLAHPPPNSVAHFEAKGVELKSETMSSSASFYTVTLTVSAGSQQNDQLPDSGAYGGGVGPANGSGVATISAIPPSVWGGSGGVSPAQVTASRAAQDNFSLLMLFSALVVSNSASY